MKLKVILILAAAVGCGVVAWALFKPVSKETVVVSNPDGRSPAAPVAASNEMAVTQSTAVVATPDTPAVPPAPQPKKREQNPNRTDVASSDPQLKINGYLVQDPMARIALSFVGSDPDADSYWTGAINDSAVPAEERKDLIEDLNEDGLSDPHHPTAQDMPLIVARMRLIERLAPNAMDDVNRDAFAEAYKDLNDLLNGKEPQ